MGSAQSRRKNKKPSWKEVKGLRERVLRFEKEINEMTRTREDEAMTCAMRKGEWRIERKRMKEEMNRLRMRLEERKWRDEAVVRWKQLYLAIKVELDDLVERTNQGERLCWKTEEEDLVEELKLKEQKIEYLQARLSQLEQENFKKEREVDILRQSLKIMIHSNYKNKEKPTSTDDSLTNQNIASTD